MKSALLFILPFILVVSVLPSPVANPRIDFPTDTTGLIMPKEDHIKAQAVISDIISIHHYRKTPLNDSLSSVIFDNYLSSLDFNKLYFKASDIKSFEQYRYSMDDHLRQRNLVPAYHIFNVFKKNFQERYGYAKTLLAQPFDFSSDEYYETDREKAPWPATPEEQNEEWRKMIKSQALNLRLTGKDEEGIRKVLTDRFDRLHKAISQYNSEDVFSMYMNAFAEAYDPHTSYFSPAAKDNFKIDMSKSLEGIGATLRTDNDYTKVAEIVPGGPAFKSKKIHKDDRIIAVGQGEDGEMVDVLGWRLDEVVKLIRGPKGTTVRLQILSASEGVNAMPSIIKIVRDKVKLEEQTAKKELITINQNGKNYKMGVITVPNFYINFEDAQKGVKDYNSTTRDVKRLVEELKKEGMDGLVIDLRYNGGGSLLEAIEMTGLFIPKGPVVQVKNSDGSIESGDDKNPLMVYNGPLTVLTNRFSASASEIFAGAIQDYKRGMVIGEQTYGKGTVQNLIDLQRFIPNAQDDLGQIKLTLAKYYRVSGKSTQHKGVNPDITLPSPFSADLYGESSQAGALPYDEIKASAYIPTNHLKEADLAKVQQKYNRRLMSDKELQKLVRDIEAAKKEERNTLVSLNETIRKKEMDEAEQRRALMDKLAGNIDPEATESKTESVKIKDIYLKETLSILADLIEITG